MVRDAAGEPPAPQPELEIEEVHDDGGVAEAWQLLNEAFLGGVRASASGTLAS